MCLNGFANGWSWRGDWFHALWCTMQCIDLANIHYTQMLQEGIGFIVCLNVILLFCYITTVYVRFENTFSY